MSRSTVASQRTIAIQSLGRVVAGLYDPTLWVPDPEDATDPADTIGIDELRESILTHGTLIGVDCQGFATMSDDCGARSQVAHRRGGAGTASRPG